MPRFLYFCQELLGVLGCDTPQSPGTDFEMAVWIEASDEHQAARWGRQILNEFVRQRFRFSGSTPDPSSFEGALITDPEMIEILARFEPPVCNVGEFPNWIEPWKNDKAAGSSRCDPKRLGGNSPTQ